MQLIDFLARTNKQLIVLAFVHEPADALAPLCTSSRAPRVRVAHELRLHQWEGESMLVICFDCTTTLVSVIKVKSVRTDLRSTAYTLSRHSCSLVRSAPCKHLLSPPHDIERSFFLLFLLFACNPFSDRRSRVIGLYGRKRTDHHNRIPAPLPRPHGPFRKWSHTLELPASGGDAGPRRRTIERHAWR